MSDKPSSTDTGRNNSAAVYPDDKLYRFHWRNNSSRATEGYGRDVADAFTRLGYGAGALPAVDYYEEVK